MLSSDHTIKWVEEKPTLTPLEIAEMFRREQPARMTVREALRRNLSDLKDKSIDKWRKLRPAYRNIVNLVIAGVALIDGEVTPLTRFKRAQDSSFSAKLTLAFQDYTAEWSAPPSTEWQEIVDRFLASDKKFSYLGSAIELSKAREIFNSLKWNQAWVDEVEEGKDEHLRVVEIWPEAIGKVSGRLYGLMNSLSTYIAQKSNISMGLSLHPGTKIQLKNGDTLTIENVMLRNIGRDEDNTPTLAYTGVLWIRCKTQRNEAMMLKIDAPWRSVAAETHREYKNRAWFEDKRHIHQRQNERLRRKVSKDSEIRPLVSIGPHPNIISIASWGTLCGLPYMLAPYYSGGALDRYMGGEGNAKLDEKDQKCIMLELAKVLAYADEKGWVYTDLKPANVALYQEDTTKHCVLIDPESWAEKGSALELTTENIIPPEYRENKKQKVATPLGVYQWALLVCLSLIESSQDVDLAELSSDLLPQRVLATDQTLSPECNQLLRNCLDPDPTNRPSWDHIMQVLSRFC
jgi:hypothetical protein